MDCRNNEEAPAMDYHEIMRATMSPNVYDGPKCDQHRPRWHAHLRLYN